MASLPMARWPRWVYSRELGCSGAQRVPSIDFRQSRKSIAVMAANRCRHGPHMRKFARSPRIYHKSRIHSPVLIMSK